VREGNVKNTSRDRVEFWLAGAEEALKSATVLFDSGMYLHSLFFCHLAAEKGLKAAVERETRGLAPKTHNLMYLLKLANLSPSAEMLDFLGQLNTFNVPTRYADQLPEIEKTFDRARTYSVLGKTRDMVEWTKELTAS